MIGKSLANRRIGLFAALFILAATLVGAPAVAAESQLPGTFRGEAWGNRGNVQAGEISTRLGRAAYQPCPCHGTNGAVRSNSVDSVSAGDAYRAGHIVSTAQAMKQTGLRAFAQTTSRVTDLSVLDGLVTADTVRAVATVRADTSSIRSTPEGSAIVNLRIAGASVRVDPGRRVNVPGFGYVSIYNISRFGNGTSLGGVTVEMLRIVITRENALDIPVGAVIVVGHARVGFSRTEAPALLGGAAWGSQATSTLASIENRMGRSAAVYLGCFGRGTTQGGNRVDSTDVPNILKTHVVLSRINASAQAGLATVTASSRLENVSLLNGVLTADVIRGVATATVNGTGGSTSFAGSRFVDLRVLGVAIGDDVAPNTRIEVPGLGTLTLYATQAARDSDSASAGVWMVILDVEVANDFGLPIGTEIRLARARATAEP